MQLGLPSLFIHVVTRETTTKFPGDNELTQRVYNSLGIQYSKMKGGGVFLKYFKFLILGSSYCAFRWRDHVLRTAESLKI